MASPRVSASTQILKAKLPATRIENPIEKSGKKAINELYVPILPALLKAVIRSYGLSGSMMILRIPKG
jgi:hypothetical protein